MGSGHKSSPVDNVRCSAECLGPPGRAEDGSAPVIKECILAFTDKQKGAVSPLAPYGSWYINE